MNSGMRKAVINALLIVQFVSILALVRTAGAAPPGEVVSVTYSSGNDQLLEGYLLSGQSSKTVSFTIGPKPGKVIKDLAWYDLNGNRIRSAQGDWLNKPSFSTTSEPIQGTPLDVMSVSTSPYSGIYFWDRSGGSHEWRAEHSGKTVSSNNCPPVSTRDEWGLRAYPNCTDMVTQPVPVTAPYVVQTEGPLYKRQVKASVVDRNTIDSDVEVNERRFEYISPHGKTVLAQAFEYQFSNITHIRAPSSTEVEVTFVHYSGPDSWQNGYYQDWANPGARQMWYFFNFDVTVTGKTYLYQDKQLYVVWGDAEPDKPDLVAVDIAANGSVEVGKPASFTAKWRVDHKATGQPYNVKIMVDGTQLKLQNQAAGGPGNYAMDFTYTFTSTAQKTFLLVVDSANAVDESNESNNQVSKSFKAVDPIKNFTGDFDVLPPVIEFRESFQLKPKNLVFNGCTYDGHRYRIERDGSTAYTSWATSPNSIHSYFYSNYPWVIGIGRHTITLEIRTKECGSAETATHTLVVNGPSSNNPPVFQVGWTNPGQWRADAVQTRVMVGTRLDLVYLDDPAPYDPDGDSFTFVGFDFSSSNNWVKQIPEQYTSFLNGFHHILMDTEGVFCATGVMRDAFGLTSTSRSCVEVVPPNPVPVIWVPDRIVEGRPVDPPIHGDLSYSPVPGRTIDHSRDIWTNRRSVYPNPGPQTVTLEVFDNTGLKSKSPASVTFEVKPDLPPVPVLEFPPVGLRNTDITFVNKSYSPDGDMIVQNQVKYWYDSNNDGSSSGETVRSVTMDSNNRFVFRPDRVGKYHFIVELKEDWGRIATGTFVLDVVNEKPSVTFSVSSVAPVPTAPEYTAITVDELLSASWKTTTFDGYYGRKDWYKTSDGYLATNPAGAINKSNEYVIYHHVSPYNAFNPNNPIQKREVLDEDRAEVHLKDEYTFSYTREYSASWGYYYRTTFSTWDGSESISRDVTYGSSFVGPGKVYHTVTYACGSYTTYNVYYWTFDRYFDANDYGTIYESCSRSGGTYGPESRLTDNLFRTSALGYGFVTSLYNGNFVISGVVKYAGTNQNEVLWTYPIAGQEYRSSYSFSDFAENKDGTKVAFFFGNRSDRNTHFIVLDTRTGEELLNRVAGPASYSGSEYTPDYRVHVAFEDKILVYSYTLGKYQYFDFEGNVLSTINHTLLSSDRIYEISKDGYLFAVYKTSVYGGYNVYLRIFDLKGNDLQLVTEQLVGTEYTTSGNFYADVISLVGDGKLYVRYRNSEPNSDTNYRDWILYTDTPSPRKKLEPDITFGQFKNDQLKIKDGEFLYTLNAKHNLKVLRDENTHAGFSFRIKDDKNMYRVESDMYHTRLVKIVNGVKTVLSEVRYDRDYHTDYKFKVTAYGSTIRVFINGSLQISVNDSTFLNEGAFGIYSKTLNAAFKDVKYYDALADAGGETLYNTLIVGETLAYDVLFTDPENDPRITALDRWTYVHENPNKFLNAGDGKSGTSAHHNKAYQGMPLSTLDKVGLYRIELASTDDPHPNYRHPKNEFSGYRETSMAFARHVIVHRPPVAQFSLSVHPVNKQVIWNDTSYDPDRWLSSTNYSTEATGIDYRTTRGILERKYYYVTPSGITINRQLVAPTETGTYTVGLAVRDEYGAWSNWAVQTIQITATAAPNEPPKAGFTVSPSTGYRGTVFTITSTASDKEDGPAANLEHAYYIGNVTEGTPETLQSASRGTWTKTFSTLGTFRIRQVVTDSVGQTDQAIRSVTVVNRKPQANVTNPSGTSSANPTRYDTLRPTFAWSYSDADGDAQTQYQVQIYRAGGTLERDTGARSGSVTSWTPTADLPERVTMYVQVQVYDGYDWSDWSAPKYFYIETNRPPAADFDWTPKPVYEGDMVQLVDRSSDPDGDALTYDWQIAGPGGINLAFTTKEPGFRAERPGSYTIRLTVGDGKATAQASRTMSVLPLTIAGEVHHTPEWREKHAAAGHEVEHDPKDFFSGEVIRVAAVISEAPANEVTAELRAVSKTGDPIRKKAVLTAAGGLRYDGVLHDESWMTPDEGIREGEHTVVFQVVYRNGVTKETSVPIRIIGNIYKAVSVHRVQ